MAVSRFQDLVAWQRARLLATEVYLATNEGQFSRDYGLARQIRRSAVSVMANIAEGFARNRTLEFQHYLDIARGSCAETHSHLYVALDVHYIDKPAFDRLEARCEEVGRTIRALRASISSQQPPGPRTRDLKDPPGEGR